MYSELHSREENEFEHKDQKMFFWVVVSASIALLVLFALAFLVTPFVGRSMHSVKPDAHPTSRLVLGQPDRWVA